MGEAFAQWLDGRAVFVVQTKQWLIWNGSIIIKYNSSMMKLRYWISLTALKTALLISL